MNIKDRRKPEYKNPARFFDAERRRPAQKPTPMSPTHGTRPRETIIINPDYYIIELCVSKNRNDCKLIVEDTKDV